MPKWILWNYFWNLETPVVMFSLLRFMFTLPRIFLTNNWPETNWCSRKPRLMGLKAFSVLFLHFTETVEIIFFFTRYVLTFWRLLGFLLLFPIKNDVSSAAQYGHSKKNQKVRLQTHKISCLVADRLVSNPRSLGT